MRLVEGSLGLRPGGARREDGLFICYLCTRILWAFARDGGVPYSQLCRKVHRDMGMPVNAVIASTGFSILLALPLLRNYTAFYATISIAILGAKKETHVYDLAWRQCLAAFIMRSYLITALFPNAQAALLLPFSVCQAVKQVVGWEDCTYDVVRKMAF